MASKSLLHCWTHGNRSATKSPNVGLIRVAVGSLVKTYFLTVIPTCDINGKLKCKSNIRSLVILLLHILKLSP